MIHLPGIPRIENYIDFNVYRTINQVSNVSEEIRNRLGPRNRNIFKFVGFIGDWGVGKESLAMKVLEMDIPNPKLEEDHASVRRKYTDDIDNWHTDENIDFCIRIFPGSYAYRFKDEVVFNYIQRRYYRFDALAFCFALNSRESFDNLKYKWIPLTKAALDVDRMPMFILVGTKSDLNPTVNDVAIGRLQRSSGARYSFECSVHENKGVNDIRFCLASFIVASHPSTG